MYNFFSLLFSTKLILCLFFSTLEATEEPSPLTFEVFSEEATMQPGRPFWVILNLNLQKGWHTYWKNPGDSGLALEVNWDLPEGYTASSIIWPTPERFVNDNVVSFGYSNNFQLLCTITPSIDSPTGSPEKLTANVNYISCSDENCTSDIISSSLYIPISEASPQKSLSHKNLFSQAKLNLPKLLDKVIISQQENKYYIEIQNNIVATNKVTKASFFPDTNDQIDITKKISFSLYNQETLELQLLGLDNEKKESLSGIIVLETSSGEKLSYQINDPVNQSPPISAYVYQSFLGFLILAFIGGLILNLMPCVFPVLSFKIMSFVSMADKENSHSFKYSLAYAAGIILSFWFLAATIIIMQQTGKSVGWGFQLQEPIFVAFLTALMVIFSLNLFGVFEMGLSLTAIGEKTDNNSSLFKAFLSGIFATTMAAPCTGPFLGSAIWFAITQSIHFTFAIFTAIGLGLATPYLLLAACPAAIKIIPRPGPWMVHFKQLMGFLMLATGVWFLWVFAAQTNVEAVSLLIVALFIISFTCWIYGKGATLQASPLQKGVTVTISTCLLLTSAYFIHEASLITDDTIPTSTASTTKEWEKFSPDRLEEHLAQGTPVFVDFTAKWCLICQTNKIVLGQTDLKDRFKGCGIAKMRADWTKNDPTITEALKKYGRNGVPLYVLHIPTDDGIKTEILPQVLTPQLVTGYINKVLHGSCDMIAEKIN